MNTFLPAPSRLLSKEMYYRSILGQLFCMLSSKNILAIWTPKIFYEIFGRVFGGSKRLEVVPQAFEPVLLCRNLVYFASHSRVIYSNVCPLAFGTK